MANTDAGEEPSRSDSTSKLDRTRRKLLAMTGTGVSIGIAGCNFGNGNGDGTETGNGTGDDETPTPTDPASEMDIVEGGTLRVGMSGNVNSFDPPFSNDVPSSFGQSMIYEGLTVNDAEGNIYPWLADSFELVELQDIDRSAYKPYMVEAPVAEDDEGNRFIDTDEQIVVRDPDNDVQNEDTARILTPNETGDAVDDGVFGMQFRYELHEGIEFHNGEELTAETVVRTYERYENSMLEAQTFDAFLHAEAVDEYTVDLYGQVVNAEGARELPGVSILPEDHIDLPDGGIDPRQGTEPVGTGPYTFEEFEDEQFLVITKNENYWLEDVGLQNKAWWDGPEDFPNSPVLEEIDIDIIPDDATRSAALQNDEVDFTYGLSADTLDDFDESEAYDLNTVQAGGYDFMQHPMNVEPWDSQKLRKGVNHLIPRSAIASNIFQDYRDPAWTPLPTLARGAGTADYDALLSTLKPMNEFDPDRGSQLVQEVIDERGLETPIEIQVETNGDNDDRVRTVELIAESMQNTDLFEVTVETYEFGAFVGRILDPEYQDRGHLMYVGLSGSFNPDSFCGAVNHTRNIGQCCNANGVGWDDLDRKIDEAQEGQEVTENPERRAELYDEIWEIIVDRSGTSYINISSNTAVYNTDLKNFSSYPFSEGLLSYGLYAPYDDGQIAWMDSG
jgi:ABC-type transport system substrate-binding protein